MKNLDHDTCCGNRPAGIEIIFTPELFLHPNFFYQPIRGYTSNFDPVLKRSPLVWFQIRNIFRRRTILQNSDCIQHQTWGKDQRQRPAIRIGEGNVLLMLLSPVDFLVPFRSIKKYILPSGSGLLVSYQLARSQSRSASIIFQPTDSDSFKHFVNCV